jgi:hypothetical protein
MFPEEPRNTVFLLLGTDVPLQVFRISHLISNLPPLSTALAANRCRLPSPIDIADRFGHLGETFGRCTCNHFAYVFNHFRMRFPRLFREHAAHRFFHHLFYHFITILAVLFCRRFAAHFSKSGFISDVVKAGAPAMGGGSSRPA